MISNRIVEYVFFFSLLGVVAYIVWQIVSPLVSALALSAIIVVISYPLYEKIIPKMPKQNHALAALATTILAMCVILLPLFFIASVLVTEAKSIYDIVNENQLGFVDSLRDIETVVKKISPSFTLDIDGYLRQSAEWFRDSLGTVFVGTAHTIFLFFVALIGSFYFFRDGKEFTKSLIRYSPLPDDEDGHILHKLTDAIRGVVTGVVLIAIIQGTLTTLGLYIVGFERAVLWGSIAAFGALIPGIGTSIVFVPTIIYLLFTGDYLVAGFIAVWGMTAVGLIDNLLGPYLIGRKSSLHPFLVLISVLGGISVFGPIGFIIGPVIMSLFLVLLNLYSTHIVQDEPKTEI